MYFCSRKGNKTVNIKIGGNQVRIKPASIVLVLSVIIGIVATVILSRDPVQKAPEFGYVNPKGWRFEVRQGAEAQILTLSGGALGQAAPEEGSDAPGVSTVDASSGLKIVVTRPGTTPSSVYLRNALNLDMNQGGEPLSLKFSARSGEEGDQRAEGFPVTFTVREGRTEASAAPLWSYKEVVGPRWKEYSARIDLKDTALLNVIVAAHLGEKPGTVLIKDLRVIKDEPGAPN